MITLSLFRHAKSAWDNPALRDFDRPLAPRGENAAPLMGAFIAEHKLEPDRILCSSAKRARQTLDLALSRFLSHPEIEYLDELYHARPKDMVATLRKLPASVKHAMLLGHNPGMHALALDLARSSGDGDMASMEAKFPTAGLAVFDFDGPWDAVGPGKGRLRLFMVPKRLPKG